MGRTQIPGTQLEDGSVQRVDLDTTTAGQAVITRIVSSTTVGVATSTGVDTGTGDVSLAMLPGSADYVQISPSTPQTGGFDLTGSGKVATLVLKGASSGTTTLQAPNTGIVTTLVLPATAGTSGQCLATNGSGTLSWSPVITGLTISVPATVLTVSGSPVTQGAANITLGLASGAQNRVLATPAGATGALSVRALVNADLPNSGIAAGESIVTTFNTKGIATSKRALAATDLGSAPASDKILFGDLVWRKSPRSFSAEFRMGQSLAYNSLYFYSWRDTGSTQDDTQRSGNNQGQGYANSCSPIQVPFTGTVTDAVLTVKGVGVGNGTVTYPVTYTVWLYKVGFTTEGTYTVVNFSIPSSATPVGTYSVAATNGIFTLSGLGIAVSAGEMLAAKFVQGTGASAAAMSQSASVVFNITETV